jgi:hypothetical protein
MRQHDQKGLTMKSFTATLATVSLVIAVGAPIASAKYQPAKSASQAASLKQAVHPSKKMPGKKMPGKLAEKASAAHISKYMRGF